MKKYITIIAYLICASLKAQITILPAQMDIFLNDKKTTLKGVGDVDISGVRHGGSNSSPTATPLDAKLLTLEGGGVINGVVRNAAAEINFMSTEEWVSTGTGTAINFLTTGNGNSIPNRRMLINHDGKVAIGYQVPLARFHVQNGPGSGLTPNLNTSMFLDGNGSNYLQLVCPDNTESGILFGRPSYGGASGGIIYTAAKDLHFRNNTNDTRMVISADGNVGIGTGVPTARLEIKGSFAVSGKSTFTGVQHNYDLNGYSVIHVNGVNSQLTGIANGVNGQLVHITVSSGSTLILADNDPLSITQNRIATGSNANITITNGGGATLIYDGIASIWRVIGIKL